MLTTQSAMYITAVDAFTRGVVNWERDQIDYMIWEFGSYSPKPMHEATLADLPETGWVGFGTLSDCRYVWCPCGAWETHADDITHSFSSHHKLGGVVIYAAENRSLLAHVEFVTPLHVASLGYGGTLTVNWNVDPEDPTTSHVMELPKIAWPYPAPSSASCKIAA